MQPTLGLSICALLLAGVAAACGSSGGRGVGSAPHSEEAGPASGVFPGGKSLPIQAYMLTDAQENVVHRAVQRIADDCMRKQGFRVELPDRFEYHVDGQTPSFLDRRYAAVYDRATAARYGLHIPLQVEHAAAPEEPQMTDAELEALFGSESDQSAREEVNVSAGKLTYGGCMAQAESTLARGAEYIVSIGGVPAEPVRQLSLDPTPGEDPAVEAAQAAWSACMARSGYHLASTLADEDGIPGVDTAAPRPSKAEIALALQEVKCQDETHVVDISFDAESRYETKKIDEQAQVFAEIKKENEQLVQRAADLLGVDAP